MKIQWNLQHSTLSEVRKQAVHMARKELPMSFYSPYMSKDCSLDPDKETDQLRRDMIRLLLTNQLI